jgi:hypothetical protein
MGIPAGSPDQRQHRGAKVGWQSGPCLDDAGQVGVRKCLDKDRTRDSLAVVTPFLA